MVRIKNLKQMVSWHAVYCLIIIRSDTDCCKTLSHTIFIKKHYFFIIMIQSGDSGSDSSAGILVNCNQWMKSVPNELMMNYEWTHDELLQYAILSSSGAPDFQPLSIPPDWRFFVNLRSMIKSVTYQQMLNSWACHPMTSSWIFSYMNNFMYVL